MYARDKAKIGDNYQAQLVWMEILEIRAPQIS